MLNRSSIRPLLIVLLAFYLVLAACGSGAGDSADGGGSQEPEQTTTGDDESEQTTTGDTQDLEAIATLTIDGEPYTFVGVRGGSVLNDDFYCFVGTTGGMNATLALEGDDESELRFTFLPDDADPTTLDQKSVTAEIPGDFEHTLHDGGQSEDIEVLDFTVTDDSFTVSATIQFEELVSGVEHEGMLEASC